MRLIDLARQDAIWFNDALQEIGTPIKYMRTKRHFLPKPVYELFPFISLSLGISCIVAGHSIGLSMLGACLIAQGLFKSILRFNYRSPHQALTQNAIRPREG